MNAHAQLLWQSVTAPSAATDLARQHPDPYRLGWFYVGIASFWSFVCDLLAKAVFPQVTEVAASGPMAVFDSFIGIAILTTAVNMFSYIFWRWFWRRMSDAAVSQTAIDSAIVVSFACSTMFILPQYLLLEGVGDNGSLLFLAYFVPLLLGIAISAVAFSHALDMHFAKAFLLNLVSTVAMIFGFIAFMMVAVLAWSLVTNTPFDAMNSPVEVQP